LSYKASSELTWKLRRKINPFFLPEIETIFFAHLSYGLIVVPNDASSAVEQQHHSIIKIAFRVPDKSLNFYPVLFCRISLDEEGNMTPWYKKVSFWGEIRDTSFLQII
jgi:hypothetical protein